MVGKVMINKGFRERGRADGTVRAQRESEPPSPMDTPATDRTLTSAEQRRLRLRRARPWLVGGVALAVLYGVLRLVIDPTVQRADVRTAPVEAGPVEASIQVTGTVVPLLESVITSPVAARVVAVRRPAGDTVAAGETVVELDVAAEADAVQRAADQVQVKRVAGREEQLRLEQTVAALRASLAAARLDLEEAAARLAQQTGLFERGLVTENDVRAARVAVDKARLDVQRYEAEIESARALTGAHLSSLALEARVLDTDRAQAARRLDERPAAGDPRGRGDVDGAARRRDGGARRGRRPRGGPVGVSRRGERAGPVRAAGARRAGRARRRERHRDRGHRDRHPARLWRTARSPSCSRSPGPRHPVLRPSLRADVYVVTEARARALRVPRGPAFQGTGPQNVFVVRGDRPCARPSRSASPRSTTRRSSPASPPATSSSPPTRAPSTRHRSFKLR